MTAQTAVAADRQNLPPSAQIPFLVSKATSCVPSAADSACEVATVLRPNQKGFSIVVPDQWTVDIGVGSRTRLVLARTYSPDSMLETDRYSPPRFRVRSGSVGKRRLWTGPGIAKRTLRGTTRAIVVFASCNRSFQQRCPAKFVILSTAGENRAISLASSQTRGTKPYAKAVGICGICRSTRRVLKRCRYSN